MKDQAREPLKKQDPFFTNPSAKMKLKARNLFSFLLSILCNIKGPAHSKNENLYFLAPAQTKRMKPILVSCETWSWHWASGPV